ncbi:MULTISPECIES: prepilin-type N-terminal cleavage/methylation domain-containing protein [unclassified Methylophilus]|jgi:general secretion pathway protein G|uniref:type II secretion system protein n=1 Tax=unclassified Methylophilus TaxID=2630143 RepID=UPI00188FFD90|nr:MULTISPECIES: prepilin-type N-terminal cleavage/methylation domain-containing protein [unclassified Methylophilus]MBF5039421.1 prepilin-type N-terminal cleavage/methylation domain-containing protein [Methylophilus sp. 13]MDF0377559.1 prepilin-type N-terminal cleavage/methylation domain-containing protein [Methylophilus sp. YYY-1]MDT7849637.1 prepilin-type N-terminal cleavage/methylation domain-containing protein [Methylophilus sp. VKM B-3414]BEV08839.1 type II secretion system GspH family pr
MKRGFTLIEMLVVLAILAMLLTIVSPRFMHMLQRAKETTLRHDLVTMRDAIDKFYNDKNRYPETLDELVERQYLKSVPPDPITERADTWVITLPPNIDEQGSVFDVHSGSALLAEDGTPYALW